MQTIERGEIPITTQLRESAIGATAEMVPENFRAVSTVIDKRRGSAIFHRTGPDEFSGDTLRRITRAEEIQITEATRDERESAEIAKGRVWIAARHAREAAALHRKRFIAQITEQKRRHLARTINPPGMPLCASAEASRPSAAASPSPQPASRDRRLDDIGRQQQLVEVKRSIWKRF